MVCQRIVESWNRWHDTCQSLVASPYYAEYDTGDVVENVLYGGVFYARRNQETTWASMPADGLHDPTLRLNEGCSAFPSPRP